MGGTGVVFLIERFAVHDGPGIRVAVFLKGCPLRCWWCHSPESQRVQPELHLKADRCIDCGSCVPVCAEGAIAEVNGVYTTARDRCVVCGDCAESCPTGARAVVGREVTVADLLAEIDRSRVFLDRSGGGVTFSGGEPLMQSAFLAGALDACRSEGLHTAIETSGYAPASAMPVALAADLVFFDLKAADDDVHRRVTGVSNERILENFRRLAREHPALRVRIPLIPGINDDDANIDALGALVAAAGLREVEVLPYHTAGEAKYRRLGRPYALAHLAAPSPDTLARVRTRLERAGLTVTVGGRS
jgi:pyruvate formate lyase activating enzyme